MRDWKGIAVAGIAIVVAALFASNHFRNVNEDSMLVLSPSRPVAGTTPNSNELVRSQTAARVKPAEPRGTNMTGTPENKLTSDSATVDKTTSIEAQVLRDRSPATYQKTLSIDFDNLVLELENQMGLDPSTALLAEAYRDQLALMFDDQASKASVNRVLCGRQLCVAEFSTPINQQQPDIGTAAAERAGLALAIPARFIINNPGEPTTTRILFAATRSPKPQP